MRIALLLSGGVDSSVALHLLRRQGHEVEAYYLKVWLEDELADLGVCPWEEDLRHARAVCEPLGVPLRVVPLQREYGETVVAWSIAELAAGRTPSPDVVCNRSIKFGAFVEGLGGAYDRVASGHYARLGAVAGRRALLRGVDPVKDQTYFLHRLSEEQLGRCSFPLGGYHKTEVRRLAARLGLPNRDRRDSQGICFLGKLPYGEFVRRHLGERPGEIRELGSDRRLGAHRGYWFYTVGQRRGLGLAGGPWYVVDKDVDTNVVRVCHRDRLAAGSRRRIRLLDPHWIGSRPALAVGERTRLAVKIRHAADPAGALLAATDAGWEIRLDDADPGIAPGQPAVLYDGEVCLGGGVMAPAAA